MALRDFQTLNFFFYYFENPSKISGFIPLLPYRNAGFVSLRKKENPASSQSLEMSVLFWISVWLSSSELPQNECVYVFLLLCICVTTWVWSEEPPQHHSLSAPRFSSEDLQKAQLGQELQPLTVCWLHLTEHTLRTYTQKKMSLTMQCYFNDSSQTICRQRCRDLCIEC